MAFFFFWILFGVGVGAWASSHNRSFIGFMFLSLILSPLIGAIILLCIGKDGKECPKCKNLIKRAATKCEYCSHEESPAWQPGIVLRESAPGVPSPLPASDEKACPDCAETVKAAAKKCRFCGYQFAS